MEIHKAFLSVILVLAGIRDTTENKNADSKVLSRHKRYLVFPEGSSLSIAICMTAQTGLTPGQIFTEGINWGISYELPNDTKDFKDLAHKSKKLMQRRHRRDLYHKLETVMNSMGYDGRSCILRCLCEASRNLAPKGESLVDEILHIVFGYPRQRPNLILDGDEVSNHYHLAADKGAGNRAPSECSELYSGCPFSLIDLALGYYSSFSNDEDPYPADYPDNG